MSTPIGLVALVFLAASLPEVATAIPAPWNHFVLGAATGCVAVKALLTAKPGSPEKAQDVKITGQSRPVEVEEAGP